MKIVIIDAHGGGIGRMLAERLLARLPGADMIAIGTNAMATSNMLKAGVKRAATGENAVIVNCRTADVIAGPVGIAIADSLEGEVTPEMARAVGSSPAERFLIPITHCSNHIVGVENATLSALADRAADEICAFAAGK